MNSYLYRELSELELGNLVSESLHTSIRCSKLMTGGLFNTTYYIDVEKYGAFVLRIGPVNRHLLLSYEHNLMRTEQSVCSMCREAGVHVPEILYIDTSKNIIDRDYMIVRYIPSTPMSSAELNANDNSRICYKIGIDVAKMHSITGSRFGRISEVEDGGGYDKWSDCIIHEFNLWARMAKPTSLFSDTEYMRIKKIFEKSIPVLDEIRVPKLVHTDLWEGNILIRTDSAPEFAAIIDADRAIWGDPEIEFSSILLD